MKENPEFIGRSYKEAEKRNLSESLKEWSDESSRPIEGEIDKTEEELKMIETINLIIGSELESLAIKNYSTILPKQIHILPGHIFNERFPDFEGRAFFLPTVDAVYVNKDRVDTKARVFSGLLHELVHRASTTKFYADKDGIYDSRLGYRIRSPWKGSGRENRLRGFNELITDCTVYKILTKNQQLLENRIGITKEDIQGPIYTYMHYSPILESILRKVSIDERLSTQEVFDKLERGLFEDNLLALKDIEKCFGKGSLEILSLLETLKGKDDNDKLEKMVKDFFAEEEEQGRENIRSEILVFVDKTEKDTG